MQSRAATTRPGGRPRVPDPGAISLFSYGFRPLFLALPCGRSSRLPSGSAHL
jgi:hypothetical protein